MARRLSAAQLRIVLVPQQPLASCTSSAAVTDPELTTRSFIRITPRPAPVCVAAREHSKPSPAGNKARLSMLGIGGCLGADLEAQVHIRDAELQPVEHDAPQLRGQGPEAPAAGGLARRRAAAHGAAAAAAGVLRGCLLYLQCRQLCAIRCLQSLSSGP